MADSLKVFLDGLQDAWDAEASLSSLNGLYLHEKPPELSVGFPYYVLLPDPGVVWGTTAQSRIWEFEVEIRAYHSTPAAAAAALATVSAILDADTFTLTLSDSHDFVMCRRISAEAASPGKEVSYSSARYRFMTSEPRS